MTPIGRVLRRYSIDELPQFINVLKQDMSVVGPRLPLRREVESYNGDIKRKLLVKPGVTGLWQISGRSNLSWEKSVRLDLSYVDNWSMITDVGIILKTVGAVARAEGHIDSWRGVEDRIDHRDDRRCSENYRRYSRHRALR